MHCKDVTVKLGRLLDGEMTSWEAASLEEHLRGCATCRTGMEALRMLGSRLQDLVIPDVPETLLRKTLEHARGKSMGRRQAPGRFQLWRDWPVALRFAAAAALASACYLGLVFGGMAAFSSSRASGVVETLWASGGASIVSAYAGERR
jgi:predicted anti-sigma-YlaC factor YlaD